MGAKLQRSRPTSNFPQSKQQNSQYMHAGHLAPQKLPSGNSMAVLLVHRNILPAGFGILADSEMQLASCTTYSLRSWNPIPILHSLLRLPWSHHTPESPPGRKPAQARGGLGLLTVAKDYRNAPMKGAMCKPTFFPEQRASLTTCKAGKRWGRSSCQNVLHSKNPTRGEEGRRTNSLAANSSPSLTAWPTPPPPTRPRGSLSRKSPLKSSPSGDSLCHSARSPAALAFGRGRHLPAPRPPSLPPPLKLREPPHAGRKPRPEK